LPLRCLLVFGNAAGLSPHRPWDAALKKTALAGDKSPYHVRREKALFHLGLLRPSLFDWYRKVYSGVASVEDWR